MIIERAYAKINLFLDVCSLRADGFHNVKTLMQSVSLCDELHIDVTDSNTRNIELTVNGAELSADADNLVYRAALAYLDATDISAYVHVTLEKNIPIAAGLAGGSSDAAATLRALNRYFGALRDDELLSVAAQLGSDVPFCLVGGTALCEGRGEIMTPISGVSGIPLVIAIGDDRISTPRAFARLDELFSNFDGSVSTGSDGKLQQILTSLETGDANLPGLFNIFETDIDKNAKSVSKIKAEMLKLGAKAALMSGSGPSVFGVFDTDSDADRAAKALCNIGFRAVHAATV